MNKLNTILATLAITVLATACGKQEVSFDTLELARATAKANAEYNAKAFRSATPAYLNYGLETQGDSSQTPACPQGDGWASAKLVNKDNPAQKVGIKCSTVSASVGCMTQQDFTAKPYAADDGQCQPTTKVPHPLPKIEK